jgi:hypothetical protein
VIIQDGEMADAVGADFGYERNRELAVRAHGKVRHLGRPLSGVHGAALVSSRRPGGQGGARLVHVISVAW